MSRHSHSCEGDHNHDDTPEMGVQYSLYKKIDTANLECLNERVEGSGQNVFKAWEDRQDFSKVCELLYFKPLNRTFLLNSSISILYVDLIYNSG